MINITHKTANSDLCHIELSTQSKNIGLRQNGGRFMKTSKFAMTLLITSLLASIGFAGGAGTSGGLTLIESYGARPSSLGEAFSAVTNDLSAFGYNPASLKSLESG